MIPYLNSNIINECIKKTLEKVDQALLDWKGIKGSDKPKLIKLLKDLNLSYKKI
jgi:D-tyrosyl-tRNA(Tyr) deacylase